MTERTRNPKATQPRPPDYAAALVMLRQALGVSAVVEPQHRPSDRGVDVLVQTPLGPLALQLKSLSAGAPHGRNVVWIIPRGDAKLRNALRARDQQFVDLSGAVRLVANGLHIDREGLPPVRPTAQLSVDPFADKSSLVLRVMLGQRDPENRVWGVRELAAAADVGLATTSDSVRSLAQRGFVEVARVGRAVDVRIRDPWQIVAAWTNAYDWRLNRGTAFDAPIGDFRSFLPRLAKAMRVALPNSRWALTMHAGAALEKPHAAWDRLHLYVDGRSVPRAIGVAGLGAKLGWTPSPSGKLVLMLPHYTVSAWHGLRRVRQYPVVSELQLALDLWHYPVRGREQAEELMRAMFGPRSTEHG